MHLLNNPDYASFFALAAFVATQLLTILAALHAIMRKKDPKAAAAWLGLIVLVPLVGPMLYWLLGINRVRRKAQKLYARSGRETLDSRTLEQTSEQQKLGSIHAIKKVCARINPRRLHDNNAIELLINGEDAYPAMLKAIAQAKETIALCTYIFDNDNIGRAFAHALEKACERGVQVRVLIDDIGLRHSFPSIIATLKKRKIPFRRFHRTFWPWSFQYAQLRNHRKLLIVDGREAFFGGMNIRDNHLVQTASKRNKTQDMHFKVQGPALADFLEVFCEDWRLSSKEILSPQLWKRITVPKIEHNGIPLRVCANGPDENFDQLRWTLLGTIACAQKSIMIQSPYFLPDQSIVSALGSASLRGVEVTILVPRQNNHRLVHWAFMGGVWQLLEKDCSVRLGDEPFDHSKVLIIDSQWSFIGSSNWDARSLRLNFEFNIECYGASFTELLEKTLGAKLQHSRALTLKDIQNLSFSVRLRNACARLLTPYL